MELLRSLIVEVSVEKAWRFLRPFDSISRWSPTVREATIEKGTVDSVGSVRRLVTATGAVFRESLLSLSDIERSFTYDILEGPLAVRNYVGRMRLFPVTNLDFTLAIWEARFDCEEAGEAELVEIVGERVCANGLKGLRTALEEKVPRS